ncbi:MAG: NUDIX hydrolase [Nocardioides sp.]|uniref:NUDIX hydrolase n=1 Tax=Nocardioides sp. TaxID=35761 RepID=UPI003D6A2FC6
MVEAQPDYDGAIVIVEIAPDEVVLVHPDGDPDGPASLPGNPCRPGESPEAGAVRIVRELTGLEVRLTGVVTSFVQPGTPTGTMQAHGFVATPVGGTLLEAGPEGPVTRHRTDALPELVSVRVAIRRVLDTYLAQTE